MDYEKKYKEAQKWMESIYSELSHEQQMEAEAFFPELEESEDERIRKEIIATIHLYYGEPLEDEAKEMIAWLEKQGDKKTTDKVESKFKVGDWIIRNNEYTGVPIQVIEFKGYYRCNLNGEVVTLTPNDVHNNFHLWTIQDAKDGDVLATDDWVFIFKELNAYGKPVCYCHYDDELGFKVDVNSYMATGSEIYPATKEQRDALFAKIKEAGYEWDTEKKELKKISQRMVSAEAKKALYDKPAWSEDDETGWTNTMIMIKEVASNHYTKDSIKLVIDWLKSLKERYTWKPSDEQMNTLHHVISGCSYDIEPLVEMEEQLKKLK